MSTRINRDTISRECALNFEQLYTFTKNYDLIKF